jgi:predicted alpha/beta hydrolase family esterase
MSIDVLFIHSAGPQSGEQGSAPFVKHLRQSLGSAFRVTCPAMPAPTKPSYERWQLELERLLPGDKSPPILVGHSLGGSVLLKYLSEHKPKVPAAGLFIVAAPYWGSAGWKVEEFVLRESFARSLPNSLKVYLYQSRDDEAVDIEHLSRYSKAIPQATVRILDGGGHTFKHGLLELAEDIQALANSSARMPHDAA